MAMRAVTPRGRACLVAAAFTLLPGVQADDVRPRRVRILSPAYPGGGLDLTAQAVRRALEASGAVQQVELFRSPAGGGIIGLAQFTTYDSGAGDVLLVGGLSMITTLKANRASLSLMQTTPLARLTGDGFLLVVPPDSRMRTFGDVLTVLRARPETLPWAGSSPGSVGHLLVAKIAEAAAVDPARVPYLPLLASRDVAAAVSAGELPLGVGGAADLAPLVQSGKLRALAVSSETPLPGLATPTLREQGLPVTVVNWRGVFAAPRLGDPSRKVLLGAIATMVRHESWRETLRERHWEDLYMPGEQFAAFVADQQAEVARLRFPPPRPMAALRGHRNRGDRRWVLVLAVLAMAATLVLVLRRRAPAVPFLQADIERQLGAWHLTAAETEVAKLLLQGLRHRDIAVMRGTNELTVRHQALVIYKKAGLDSRSDLAAYFLGVALKLPGPEPGRSGRGFWPRRWRSARER